MNRFHFKGTNALAGVIFSTHLIQTQLN